MAWGANAFSCTPHGAHGSDIVRRVTLNATSIFISTLDIFTTQYYSIADAPYRPDVNKVILGMQQQGNLTKLKTRWWKDMIEGGACPVGIFKTCIFSV